MSSDLISRSSDLKKLRNEGYEVEVRDGHLLIHQVPYVTEKKEIARGVLVCPLGELAGDRTAPPQDHVIHFAGQYPCNKDGKQLTAIQHASERKALGGVEVDHSFSNKPAEGYPDYHAKAVNYIRILQDQAQAIDPTVTAKTFKVIVSKEPESVFHYLDTNSSRAEIDAISDKLKALKIAIIGLGGTGSYVLDFVAKTHAAEIHLFDGDDFLSHNAFRTPGAVSLTLLNEKPKKVAHLQRTYSQLHKNIIPHEYHLTQSALEELTGIDFVFICMDEGATKQSIIEKLVSIAVPFVDVGIGIIEVDGKLTGNTRTTMVTPEKNDHIHRRISFADGGGGEYDRNIQIAEINALNAALAVIKWKKYFGFYHDLENEHHSLYEISLNKIINDENQA